MSIQVGQQHIVAPIAIHLGQMKHFKGIFFVAMHHNGGVDCGFRGTHIVGVNTIFRGHFDSGVVQKLMLSNAVEPPF